MTCCTMQGGRGAIYLISIDSLGIHPIRINTDTYFDTLLSFNYGSNIFTISTTADTNIIFILIFF